MSKAVTLGELAEKIQAEAKGKDHFVIAISGFGGAGKSTTARQLAEMLGDAHAIALDDFITDRLSERSQDWNGFDWQRLIAQVLQPITKGGKTIQYDAYDWSKNSIRKTKDVHVLKFTIIEGIGLLRQDLNAYFDLTVWLDIPLEIATARGKKRDTFEYGVDHDLLWDTLWSPNDKDYYDKYRPQDLSDFVLTTLNS